MEDKILELMNDCQKALVKVAPQAFDFAVLHERWCGIADVGVGFGFLLLTVLFLLLALIIQKKWPGKLDSEEFPFAVIPVCLSICTFLVAAIQLINPWNWVAIYNPKVALFHDLISKFLSHN